MTKMHAVVLAAGDGKRFFESGGEIYKQLALIEGQPIIRRIASQLAACPEVAETTVVLGQNRGCAEAVMAALDNIPVQFVENPQSREDNNFLSFMAAVRNLDCPVMAVEADCVMDVSDIEAMCRDLQPDELRWSNVGDLGGFEYGGVVEVDETGKTVLGVHILDRDRYADFRRHRHGVKMFGVTSFGQVALQRHKVAAHDIPATGKFYFHECALRNPELFHHTTCTMNSGAYSFNTLLELQN